MKKGIAFILFLILLDIFCEAVTNTTAGKNSTTGGMFSDASTWIASIYQPISRVRMTCGNHGDFDVLSIKISYGDMEGDSHGTHFEPGTINYTLKSGEYIIGADVWYGEYINGITLITNYAEIPHCGAKIHEMVSFRQPPLLYISGRSGWYVDALSFHWYQGPDSCQGFLCSQNGICISTDDGYECICNEGFTGMVCESMLQQSCNCTCDQASLSWNTTTDTGQPRENIASLIIPKRKTAMFKRKLYSASDVRLSASITGYGLGVTTLVLICVIVVLMDICYVIDKRKSGSCTQTKK